MDNRILTNQEIHEILPDLSMYDGKLEATPIIRVAVWINSSTKHNLWDLEGLDTSSCMILQREGIYKDKLMMVNQLLALNSSNYNDNPIILSKKSQEDFDLQINDKITFSFTKIETNLSTLEHYEVTFSRTFTIKGFIDTWPGLTSNYFGLVNFSDAQEISYFLKDSEDLYSLRVGYYISPIHIPTYAEAQEFEEDFSRRYHLRTISYWDNIDNITLLIGITGILNGASYVIYLLMLVIIIFISVNITNEWKRKMNIDYLFGERYLTSSKEIITTNLLIIFLIFLVSGFFSFLLGIGLLEYIIYFTVYWFHGFYLEITILEFTSVLWYYLLLLFSIVIINGIILLILKYSFRPEKVFGQVRQESW